VLGNIWESYPIVWIVCAVFALAAGMTWWNRKKLTGIFKNRPSLGKRSVYALLLLILPFLGYFFAGSNLRKFSSNEYVNELAGNGLFEFGTAFWNNELDFYKFYQTLPDKQAFNILHKQLESPNTTFLSNDPFNIERSISYPGPEKRMNVVLISVESLSASFMKAFGNTQHITPHLDSLSGESIFFTNLYASVTLTVRAL
jgi:phosphoglycerol transferase MdoB-like AlkP superfamily enzyme